MGRGGECVMGTLGTLRGTVGTPRTGFNGAARPASPHGCWAGALARCATGRQRAPGLKPGVRHVLDAEGAVVLTGDAAANWAWLRERECTCEGEARAACGTFACARCERRVPACCGAADEYDTEGADDGACDDCAARAAWEREMW